MTTSAAKAHNVRLEKRVENNLLEKKKRTTIRNHRSKRRAKGNRCLTYLLGKRARFNLLPLVNSSNALHEFLHAEKCTFWAFAHAEKGVGNGLRQVD